MSYTRFLSWAPQYRCYTLFLRNEREGCISSCHPIALLSTLSRRIRINLYLHLYVEHYYVNREARCRHHSFRTDVLPWILAYLKCSRYKYARMGKWSRTIFHTDYINLTLQTVSFGFNFLFFFLFLEIQLFGISNGSQRLSLRS